MKIKDWFLDIDPGDTQRRKHIRVRTLNLIRLHTDAHINGSMVLNTTDLSECGVGFRTTYHLHEGQGYEVVLHTPERNIAASARIRWSRWVGGAEKAYEVGAEFESVREADKPHLIEFIRAFIKKDK
jgi:c-di-GMP-binding flagellar brake protein YcgR